MSLAEDVKLRLLGGSPKLYFLCFPFKFFLQNKYIVEENFIL